jgi:hypothetical protein
MVMQSDSGVSVHLYGPMETSIERAEGTVMLCQETDFPFDESVTIHIAADDFLFDVELRIPEWCGDFALETAGAKDVRTVWQSDRVRLTATWGPHSEIRLKLPEALRPLIGNRVYGCDDCQLVCPWNGFSETSKELDFQVRNGLDCATLVELFSWSETQFDERLRGSPIRRIGYERWLRNLAVGLGNAASSPEVISALRARADHASALVREHVRWALGRHVA